MSMDDEIMEKIPCIWIMKNCGDNNVLNEMHPWMIVFNLNRGFEAWIILKGFLDPQTWLFKDKTRYDCICRFFRLKASKNPQYSSNKITAEKYGCLCWEFYASIIHLANMKV